MNIIQLNEIGKYTGPGFDFCSGNPVFIEDDTNGTLDIIVQTGSDMSTFRLPVSLVGERPIMEVMNPLYSLFKEGTPHGAVYSVSTTEGTAYVNITYEDVYLYTEADGAQTITYDECFDSIEEIYEAYEDLEPDFIWQAFGF